MTTALYNTANIRTLLLEGFDDQELRRLCLDAVEFRPVYHELAHDTGKAEIVDLIIEFALAHLLVDILLNLVADLNPARYELHGPYYHLEGVAAQAKLDVVLYELHGNVHKPEKLVGREALCETVHGLLDAGHHVLLYGLGGTGKTALAATIADERIAAGKGAVIWLQPGREDADKILDALALRFATDKEKSDLIRLTGDEQSQAMSKLLSRLGAGLLVLDDVWDGRALYCVREAVPPGLPLLVTSRHVFPLDDLVEVGELAPEAALELLAHHAGQKKLQADTNARLLCEELGYHPYALEIAGATLKVDQQTPGELREQIEGAPHDLPMPEGLAAEGRESVKRLLDDSVDRLDARLKDLFRTFGALFAPGATSALIAACLNQPTKAVEASLKELVRRSLARRKPGTDFYFLQDLTFSYARALIEDVAAAHRQTVTAVERYVVSQGRDFDQLALDQNNILAAAGVAVTENVEALVSIVSTLATGGYLDVRGHTEELARLLSQAIEVVRQRGDADRTLLHTLLTKRGNVHFDRGELAEACEAYQAALDLSPNDNRRVILHAVMGKVCSEQGRRAESERSFQQGYKLAEAIGDKRVLAFLLGQASFAAGRRGDFEEARALAARAVEVATHLDPPDPNRLGYALVNLGSAECEVGIRKAVTFHKQAYDIAHTQGNHALIATAAYALGIDHHALLDRDQACRYLDEARHLFRESGNTAEETAVTCLMRDNGYPVT